MHILANVADEDTILTLSTPIEILMHFNHVYSDGISKRVLTGELLKRFGESLGAAKSQVSHSKWGYEVSNLSEPILDACKIDVKALGGDFRAAQDEMLGLLSKYGTSWGLNVGLPTGMPSTQWFRFTATETKAMIQAVKARVGPQYTISHLGHTATMLALLKVKPLPFDAKQSPTLVMPLTVNGRRYLREGFVNNTFSSCQTGAVVDFGELQSWAVDDNDLEAVKAVLERGCKHVKKWYDYWMSKEFLLPLGISKDNFTAAIFDSTPIPSGETSAPVFIADGVINQHVPNKIVSLQGEEIFSVEHCDSLLDTYLQDILIRMESWNSVTSLSLCHNDSAYTPEDAAAFLQHIAKFMLAITQ